VLDNVHTNEEGKDDHVYTKTAEDCKGDDSGFIGVHMVPNQRDDGCHQHVEQPIVYDNCDGGDPVVGLAEFLENDIVLADLVIFYHLAILLFLVFYLASH